MRGNLGGKRTTTTPFLFEEEVRGRGLAFKWLVVVSCGPPFLCFSSVHGGFPSRDGPVRTGRVGPLLPINERWHGERASVACLARPRRASSEASSLSCGPLLHPPSRRNSLRGLRVRLELSRVFTNVAASWCGGARSRHRTCHGAVGHGRGLGRVDRDGEAMRAPGRRGSQVLVRIRACGAWERAAERADGRDGSTS